mmetsp:Transcript_27439/g.71210  ORF Transcript_27439/g.71210 Transcript_27439/m.71210 type:complete len:272 (+) Transcript_27439:71-886(+)
MRVRNRSGLCRHRSGHSAVRGVALPGVEQPTLLGGHATAPLRRRPSRCIPNHAPGARRLSRISDAEASGPSWTFDGRVFPCDEFKRNAGVLYWPSFLAREEFELVAAECEPLLGRTKPERNTLAKGRRGMYLPAESMTAALLLGEGTRERVGRKVGHLALLAGDYPVELRLYPVSSYMDWHVDELMYTEPQYEMILTLENSTDSFTQWVDANGQTVSTWAEPNSLIVVKAGAALHQVTRVKKGRRAILKFILTPTLDRTQAFEDNLSRVAF